MIQSLRLNAARELPAPLWWGLVALLIAGCAALSAFVHPLVGIAAAAGLVVAPLVLSSISFAFAALAAVITLVPFGALPLNIGFNPTLLDFALGAIYVIWAGRLITRRDALSLPPGSVGVILVIGLAVAAFLAGLSHGAPTKNQMRTFGELILGAGLLPVGWILLQDRRHLRAAYLALVVLAGASAAVGLGLYALPDGVQMRALSMLSVVDYPSGPGVLRYINDDPARLQRATGTSIDPNSFGGMLAVMAALVAPQVVARRPWIDRRLAGIILGLISLALLATVSRGSLVGLAAGLGVIGLLRDRRMLLTLLLAGIAILAIAPVLPWTARYVDHFAAGLAGEDLATQMRFGEYRDAWALIQRYPLLGVGFGGVRDIDLYRGVSSLYLIVAETMGLVGLAAFVGALGWIGARLAAAWRRMAADGSRAVVLGSLAALAAAMVSGIFDHYFFTYPHAFALLWFVLVLGVRAGFPPPELTQDHLAIDARNRSQGTDSKAKVEDRHGP